LPREAKRLVITLRILLFTLPFEANMRIKAERKVSTADAGYLAVNKSTDNGKFNHINYVRRETAYE
jgi:hypothetical protein